MSLTDAFEAIDEQHEGYITKSDFKNLLNDYNIFVSQ